MTKNKFSNPKQACVNCHFLVPLMLNIITDHPLCYSDGEADSDCRERLKKKEDPYFEDPEKPQVMAGFRCAEGVWTESADQNKHKEVDWENLSDKEAIDLGDNAHADFIEKRHKRIVEKDQTDCPDFFKYTPGMDRKTARRHRNKRASSQTVVESATKTYKDEQKVFYPVSVKVYCTPNFQGLEYQGEKAKLTNTWLRLLELLWEKNGALATRGEIRKELWGKNEKGKDEQISIIVSKLKKAFKGIGFKEETEKQQIIKTTSDTYAKYGRGGGYSFLRGIVSLDFHYVP